MKYLKSPEWIFIFKYYHYFVSYVEVISAGSTDNQIMSSPSNHVAEFFYHFDHCLFRFHLGYPWEIDDDWKAYSPIVNFFAGKAVFKVEHHNHTIFVVHLRKRRKFKPVRKFGHCNIQLHLQKQLEAVEDTEDLLQRPEYVWLINLSLNYTKGLQNKDEKSLTDLNIDGLANLGYPTVFFVIWEYELVYLFCLSCKEGEKLQEFNLNWSQTWSKLFSNLHGTPIKINHKLSNLPLIQKWSCNIHKGYVPDVMTCSYFTLAEALNVTLIDHRSLLLNKIVTHGSLYCGMIISKTNTRWIILGKILVLGYGLAAKPYGYILVMDSAPSNFLAIIQPFDFKTWICLAVAIIFIVNLLSRELKQDRPAKEFFVNGDNHFWFLTVGTLLDQPATSIRLAKTKVPVFLLWHLWLIAALSISQAYKGILFSFLSNTPLPSIPKTLNSLVSSKETLFTQLSMTRMISVNDSTGATKYIHMSILKDGILQDFLESLSTKQNNSIYSKFNQSLEWIGGSTGTAFPSIVTKNHVYNQQLNKTFIIPSKFFFIDQLDHTSLFKTHLLFFTNKWASNVIPLPIFMSRTGWTIKENYLCKKIKEVMAQMCESGLYERWDKFYQMDDIVYYIKEAAMLIRKEIANDTSSKRRVGNGKQYEVSLKTLFHYVYMNQKKELPFAGTLPRKVYSAIFWYILLCLALACILFVAEQVIVRLLIN